MTTRRREPDLRRVVPRLRDQGADVPVPHVAPRRAHRGADGRFGAPRRDPAEARHLRLHPHRVADPPDAAKTWAPWIGLLAVIGIIYGALGCLAQTDMKRLIAFSSVAHMGFVMLGISTLTSFGINAAIFGMVAHGLITGMLFFIAGTVQHTFHTREMSRLGGLLIQAPKLGWILGFCAMASLGSARPRRLLGRVPRDPLRVQPGGPAARGDVPRVHGRRRDRHRARGRLPAVDAAEGRVRHTEAGVRARAHPRRHGVRVDRVDSAPAAHRRARRVPEPPVPGHRRRA